VATPAKVNDTYVWILAFGPVIYLIMIVALRDLGVAAVLILNVLLCALDASGLRRQGYNPPHPAWGLLFLPVYVFLRPSRVGGPYWYVYVFTLTWGGMFAAQNWAANLLAQPRS